MRTTFISRVAAVMFLLVFSLLFVFATFSYGSEPGEEKVCLRKPNAEELAIIVRYNKDQSGDRGWAKSVSSASVDINNDGKKDIVYSDINRTGSCGYSWAVLLNEGNGKYKQFDIFVCIGECVTFLKEMKNGFRLAKIGDTILEANSAKTDEGGLYVERKGRR